MPKGKRSAKKVQKEVEEDPVEESDEDLSSDISSGEESDQEPTPKPAPKRAPKKTTKKTTKKTVKRTTKKAPAKRASKKASTKKTKKDDEEEPGKRYFKILTDTIRSEDNSPDVEEGTLSSGGGRYTGRNPMQAAKKAFTRIARAATEGGECTYIFSIQETTQGSVKKVFTYKGVREELETPQIIKKGETEYKIRFRSVVRSYKKDIPAKKDAQGVPKTRKKRRS